MPLRHSPPNCLLRGRHPRSLAAEVEVEATAIGGAAHLRAHGGDREAVARVQREGPGESGGAVGPACASGREARAGAGDACGKGRRGASPRSHARDSPFQRPLRATSQRGRAAILLRILVRVARRGSARLVGGDAVAVVLDTELLHQGRGALAARACQRGRLVAILVLEARDSGVVVGGAACEGLRCGADRVVAIRTDHDARLRMHQADAHRSICDALEARFHRKVSTRLTRAQQAR
mmetsp:Transcript_15191/g.38616  ORF Transcript_15191/g.38616 Transcript_15191/m.38616 type:complete len:237 (+) Transcript_15191:1787-2497(+)